MEADIIDNTAFVSYEEAKQNIGQKKVLKIFLVGKDGKKHLAVTGEDLGDAHYHYRSSKPFKKLEMVIHESGGQQEGAHLQADEQHPDGVYFTSHRSERAHYPDGRRCNRWYLIDQHGGSHLAVIGVERDTKDGHYSYSAEEPFASIAPLHCSNQAGVFKWLEKMITHHAAGSGDAGGGPHSGAGSAAVSGGPADPGARRQPLVINLSTILQARKSAAAIASQQAIIAEGNFRAKPKIKTSESKPATTAKHKAVGIVQQMQIKKVRKMQEDVRAEEEKLQTSHLARLRRAAAAEVQGDTAAKAVTLGWLHTGLTAEEEEIVISGVQRCLHHPHAAVTSMAQHLLDHWKWQLAGHMHVMTRPEYMEDHLGALEDEIACGLVPLPQLPKHKQALGPATAGAYGPGSLSTWPHAAGAVLAGLDPAGAQAAAAFLTPMGPGPAAWAASGHKGSIARGLTSASSAAAAAGAGAGRLMYQGMLATPGTGAAAAAAGFGELPIDAGMRPMGLYGQQHMAGQGILDPAVAAGAMYGCPTTTAMAAWPADVAGNVYGTAADVFGGSAGAIGVDAMPLARTAAGSSTDLVAMLADGTAEAAEGAPMQQVTGSTQAVYLFLLLLLLTDRQQQAFASTEAEDAVMLQQWLLHSNPNVPGLNTWVGKAPCTDGLDLTVLDLSHNQLTGTIPASLVGRHLKKLLLNDNLLRGSIPYCLMSPAAQPPPSDHEAAETTGTPNSLSAPLTQLLITDEQHFISEAHSGARRMLAGQSTVADDKNALNKLHMEASMQCGGRSKRNSSLACLAMWKWGAMDPCGTPNCTACKAEHTNCGVYDNATSSYLCEAAYIECSNERIIKILPGLLSGPGKVINFTSIPSFFFNLSELQELNLAGHQLLGPLPPQMSGFSKLRVLKLSGPFTSSPLPSTWSALVNLQTLWLLDMTGVQGSLPASWSSLTNLTELRMTGAAQMNGSVPASWAAMSELQVVELTNLTSLSGSLPWAAGPTSLTNLQSLQLQNLPRLMLPNGPMSAWANSPSLLKKLVVSNVLRSNRSLDSLDLMHYKNVSAVVLSGAGLIGPFPGGWAARSNSSYSKLQTLDVSDNALTGTLPAWVPTVLTPASPYLDMTRNQFSGSLPVTWSGNFGTLRLSNNLLTGTIPNSWASLVYNSVKVDVTNNKLNGSLGAGWGATFTAAAAINGSMKTQEFRTRDPSSQPCGNTTGNGTWFCNWPFIECRDRRVVQINMAQQGMVFRTLPVGLATNTVLEVLDLSGCTVLGEPLPAEYGAWINMTAFRVQGAVEGQLPATYASWTKLKVFEARDTWLTGTVPPQFFTQWVLLERFTIDGAYISGSLPVPWACQNLSSYVVQNTPASMAAWITPVPAGAQNLTKMKQFGIGNTKVQSINGSLDWTTVALFLRNTSWPLQDISAFGLSLTGSLDPLGPWFPNLRRLDLSYNQLTGSLPANLLTSLTSLSYLSLSNNQLNGVSDDHSSTMVMPHHVAWCDISHS
eukprot:gene11533-11676_t